MDIEERIRENQGESEIEGEQSREEIMIMKKLI